jgi:hypothetical protein
MANDAAELVPLSGLDELDLERMVMGELLDIVWPDCGRCECCGPFLVDDLARSVRAVFDAIDDAGIVLRKVAR